MDSAMAGEVVTFGDVVVGGMTTSSDGDGSKEAGLAVAASVSIFDVHSRARKRCILLCAATISMTTPFTDTIYLPALASVQRTLPDATEGLAAASVSVYMITCGLGMLVWGSVSDRFGRKQPLLASLLLYEVFTVACIFAPTAAALVGLRAAEGAVTGATVVVTQGAVADVYAPFERGTASGLFLVPLLVGPIIAPLVGGAVSTAMDWRATFILLAVLGGFMLVLAILLPETHQVMVVDQRKMLAEQSGEELSPITEDLEGTLSQPVLVAPWQPLRYLVEPSIAPYAAALASTFMCLFVSMTLLPAILAAEPYGLPDNIIGVCFVPCGIAMMGGCVLGGMAADKAAASAPNRPSARLVPSLLGAVLQPGGCLIFGLCFEFKQPLGAALVGHALIGIAMSLLQPGLLSYLSVIRQDAAAAVGASVMSTMFVLAGIGISIAVPLRASLGTAGLFGLLGAVQLATVIWSAADAFLRGRGKAEAPSGALKQGIEEVAESAKGEKPLSIDI